MTLFLIMVCVLAKSEILTLICVSLIVARFLYRIAEDVPNNGI